MMHISILLKDTTEQIILFEVLNLFHDHVSLIIKVDTVAFIMIGRTNYFWLI